ncbi:potassium-transporting ATPase subunit KdpC [Micrococcus luteus]|uniref:potassium-transporting ATPase subunit KdpC n=1 Tax=Micrococcus luteus TaxID=1270 RepID=UPI00367B5798
MTTSTRQTGRAVGAAVRAMAVFTLALGLLYPAVITAVGQLALPAQANGSIVRDASGAAVGSALIGQSFSDAEGSPLPRYFQTRPSAAGDAGYDGGASSGSNLGPENEELVAAIAERRAQIAELEQVSEDRVPADAVTASSSGLDPHISPAYAELQVARVARERGLPEERVREAVRAHTREPALGFLGEPVVDVLALNLALDGSKGV